MRRLLFTTRSPDFGQSFKPTRHVRRVAPIDTGARPMKRILVAFDGDEPANRALDRGAELAQASGLSWVS
jgi:hypothetical protein